MTPAAQRARALFATSAPAVPLDNDTSASFLRLLFQGQDHGFAVLFVIPGDQALFFDLSESDWAQQAAAAAQQMRSTRNVYIGVCTQPVRLDKGRGKEADIVALPGLWADIDVLGPNHHARDLPPTIEDAWTILEGIPFRPTVVVHSGGGLQLYWLFREPLEIKSEADRRRAKTLTTAFLSQLNAIAGRRKWRVDATADLARILRLPGTFNRKQATPVPVMFSATPGEPRYNPSEIEDFLALEADPVSRQHTEGTAPSKPKANFNTIAGGCSWLRHCRDDAHTLPEPEWYRALSVLSRCRGGRDIAHEISSPYPDYVASETDKKFDQAFNASGPATCGYINQNYPGYCRDCVHLGRIKSPVVLGLQKRRLQPPTPEPDEQPALIRVESEVEAAIAANDITRVYRLIGDIALLREDEILLIRARLEKNFGKEFKTSDFKRAVKEKRAEARRNALRSNDLPVIPVNTQWVRNATEQALPALQRANDPPYLFVRSGEMVHVTMDELQRPGIVTVNEDHLRGRLDRVANFVRSSEDGDMPVPVPMDLVRDIMSIDSRHWRMPALRSVVEVPSLRPDGTVIDRPGYDPRSGMYYAPTADLVTLPVPDDPVTDDVAAALEFIDEAIGEFPYADQTSKANSLGLLLTPIIRTAIDGCTPLALIDAPKAGTGKSLFVDVLSTIISGRPAPMTPFPRNDEEMQKQIGACLMAGRPIICFDNLEGTLQAPSLALAITAKEYEARILGVSRNMTVPNNATWIVTGNNIRPSGDMPRRCYQIRLDAKMSNPALGREFRHSDLLGFVRKNRARLLHALLVLARAWYAAGAPLLVPSPLGSFEAWHRTVGSILAYAKVEGFLATVEEFLSEADEVANQWEGFLRAIWEHIKDEFTVADLVKRIEQSEELQQALPDRLQEAKGKSSFPVEIGKAFGKRREQRMGDIQIYLKLTGRDRRRMSLWTVLIG